MCVSSGDTVLTTYGAAVVVKTYRSEDGKVASFKARIWRIPSKSIASSSVAYLQSNCIIKRLPAAPGMTTMGIETTGGDRRELLIHCYSPRNDTYLVSQIDEEINQRVDIVTCLSRDDVEYQNENNTNTMELLELKSNEIQISKSAKFYPLIDELILRGNEASAAAKNIFKDVNITTMKSIGEKKWNNFNSEKVTNFMKQSVPNSEDVKSIYKMLKDEELTVLLEKGRERLQQLSSGGLNEATENVLKEMGVTINDDKARPSLLVHAQAQALEALDVLLAENLNVSLDSMKTSVGRTFATMFDSFSAAAQSDGTLHSVLIQINEKTSEWQQQTGRLLETKSSSLFFEGAHRIQSRVGNLLSPQLFSLNEESKESLTKAFTEGDIALAKLKSLEIGDSIRLRLFDAIEARSESHGGLDAIIAGAVDQMGGEEIINSMKQKTSSISADSNESLIALLSDRSKYHDITVLRLEQTLLHLESHLDQKMTAEEIASLARGEEGTAALFEPIAKNAAKEIEKQLDFAEASITDPTILSVIAHVRKIMSGELTMKNLFDEVTKILDNDDVVNVGVMLAQRGEQFLDAIETASENKTINDLISAAEKAGITKESVVGQIETMDINNILDTAEQAVSNDQKRTELLSSATDSALDFLLRILPEMPVPPFEGVTDGGLLYTIDNLSMKGFKLRKEDIMVEIAGIKATEQSRSNATIIPSPLTGNDVADRNMKSTDILIIDVRNISATLENALWKFEKTSFPYVKSSGSANVNLSDGTIRLEYELRKKKTGDVWTPVLCLHNRMCTIGQIDLTIDGAKGLAWVVNRLAAIFRGPLKNYVVKVIMDILANRSGWLLQNLNGILSPHWTLLLKTTALTMDDLEEADDNSIIAELPDPAADEIDLVWNEFVPLGINLIINDKSGFVKVKDFPRGSQARQVAIKKEIDPDIVCGATIIAVNGKKYDHTERMELIEALREPERPKTVKFKLRTKKKVIHSPTIQDDDQNDSDIISLSMKHIQIQNEGPIGIEFGTSIDNYALTVDTLLSEGLVKEADHENEIQLGDILVAVNGNKVIEGPGPWIQKSYEYLQKDGLCRPLKLDFAKPYLFKVVMTSDNSKLKSDGPEELSLGQRKVKSGASKIFVENFRGVDGAAESSGVIIGDNLIVINGMPVGAGMKLRPGCPILDITDVNAILNDPRSYPMCLHFARQVSSVNRKAEFDVESKDMKTIPVTIADQHQLGCTIQKNGVGSSMKFLVREFCSVSGYFKGIIDELIKEDFKDLTFYSIDGEILPSYTSCEMVMNAMKRGWRTGRLEIVFCNEKIKEHLVGTIM